ncbi:hypothetical protein FJZ31_21115 [Candidatus Poribacteria bacterium]|nr:hypothetical protein [Candidatus Poribacteria bacterium]
MTKAEKYATLNHKYLKEADALLEKGDYVQASEKLWGAAASIVKNLAAKRGINLKSRPELAKDQLYKFVNTLSAEFKDPELVKSFGLASFLHQNFYEDWLPPETVLIYSEAVKQLVEKLENVV